MRGGGGLAVVGVCLACGTGIPRGPGAPAAPSPVIHGAAASIEAASDGLGGLWTWCLALLLPWSWRRRLRLLEEIHR